MPDNISNIQNNKQKNKGKDFGIHILLSLQIYNSNNGNIKKRTTVTGPIPKDSNWKQ
jgi:hypothetical protein